MPIQLNPLQRPHLQRHLIQVLRQPFNLRRLEQTNQFQVVPHEPGRMLGESCDHALTNVVWVTGDLHVPQHRPSVCWFLLAHLVVGILERFKLQITKCVAKINVC